MGGYGPGAMAPSGSTWRCRCCSQLMDGSESVRKSNVINLVEGNEEGRRTALQFFSTEVSVRGGLKVDAASVSADEIAAECHCSSRDRFLPFGAVEGGVEIGSHKIHGGLQCGLV